MLTKLWNKIKSFFVKAEKVDLTNLEKKTKKELEELGRKLGVELDKRLTKAKLIQQLKKNK